MIGSLKNSTMTKKLISSITSTPSNMIWTSRSSKGSNTRKLMIKSVIVNQY